MKATSALLVFGLVAEVVSGHQLTKRRGSESKKVRLSRADVSDDHLRRLKKDDSDDEDLQPPFVDLDDEEDLEACLDDDNLFRSCVARRRLESSVFRRSLKKDDTDSDDEENEDDGDMSTPPPADAGSNLEIGSLNLVIGADIADSLGDGCFCRLDVETALTSYFSTFYDNDNYQFLCSAVMDFTTLSEDGAVATQTSVTLTSQVNNVFESTYEAANPGCSVEDLLLCCLVEDVAGASTEFEGQCDSCDLTQCPASEAPDLQSFLSGRVTSCVDSIAGDFVITYELPLFIIVDGTPTDAPLDPPVSSPTGAPVAAPVSAPTGTPVAAPVSSPTGTPVAAPVSSPTGTPVAYPLSSPTGIPVAAPVSAPTGAPVAAPVAAPTGAPVSGPAADETDSPTSVDATDPPTESPVIPVTSSPTVSPTSGPTFEPSPGPTVGPTFEPSPGPTVGPTFEPSPGPTTIPSFEPTPGATSEPTFVPTFAPPTKGATFSPTFMPTFANTIDPTDELEMLSVSFSFSFA